MVSIAMEFETVEFSMLNCAGPVIGVFSVEAQ